MLGRAIGSRRLPGTVCSSTWTTPPAAPRHRHPSERAHQVDVVGLAVPRLHRVPRLQQGAGRTAVHEEMV